MFAENLQLEYTSWTMVLSAGVIIRSASTILEALGRSAVTCHGSAFVLCWTWLFLVAVVRALLSSVQALHGVCLLQTKHVPVFISQSCTYVLESGCAGVVHTFLSCWDIAVGLTPATLLCRPGLWPRARLL